MRRHARDLARALRQLARTLVTLFGARRAAGAARLAGRGWGFT